MFRIEKESLQNVVHISLEYLEKFGESARIRTDGLALARGNELRRVNIQIEDPCVVFSCLVHAKIKHNDWYSVRIRLDRENIKEVECWCNKITRYIYSYSFLYIKSLTIYSFCQCHETLLAHCGSNVDDPLFSRRVQSTTKAIGVQNERKPSKVACGHASWCKYFMGAILAECDERAQGRGIWEQGCCY